MINLLQRSLDRRRLAKAGLIAGAAVGAADWARWSAAAQDAADLPSDASDMEALIAGAQRESKIVSYGMPDYWANLGEMWSVFMEKYGIAEHEDADLSSAQEIAKFLAEAENPIADIGDIGIQFAPTAIQFGVCAPFKNDTWDRIPDEVGAASSALTSGFSPKASEWPSMDSPRQSWTGRKPRLFDPWRDRMRAETPEPPAALWGGISITSCAGARSPPSSSGTNSTRGSSPRSPSTR